MKKEIKLNLVTFCLINAMNINIAEAQTEEILDQINGIMQQLHKDQNLNKTIQKCPYFDKGIIFYKCILQNSTYFYVTHFSVFF